MASPLKFILALDAKMADMPRLERTLISIAKVLNKLDPGLKMTKAGLYGIGFAAGSAIKGFFALGRAAKAGASMAVSAMGSVGRAMGAAGGFLGKQAGGFFKDAASSFLGFASFEGLKALATGAVHASMEMVKLASAAGDTQRILSTIAGPQDAKRVQALADAFAKSSGIDSDAFNSMATGLLRAGLPLKQLENFFALASDITGLTQGLPDKAAKTAKAMEVGGALVNMQRKGGFDRKLLADVGVSEDEFFGQIAKMKNIGLAEASARGKLPSGKGGFSSSVLFAAAERSLAGVRKGAPGSIGDAMGASAGSQLERLTGTPADLAKSLAGSKGIDDLGAALGRIADLFDPDSPNGKRITESLDRMLQQVAKSLQNLDIKGISDSLISLFTKLPGLIDATTRAGVAFLELLGKLNTKTPEGSGGGRAGEVGGGLPDLGKPLMRIAKRPKDWKWGEDLEADALFRMAEGQGQNVDKGMAAGLSSGAAPDAFDLLIEDMKAKPPAELEMHSPSKLFERYGRQVGQGFADGLDASSAKVDRALPAPSMDIRAPKARGAGTAGGVTVSAPITVNYTGAGGEAAAQEIAEVIKDLLPGQLQSAFSRLALEAGTA
jgi:hypothetical protein